MACRTVSAELDARSEQHTLPGGSAESCAKERKESGSDGTGGAEREGAKKILQLPPCQGSASTVPAA